MATILGELSVVLGMDASKFDAQSDKIVKKLDNISTVASRAEKAILGIFSVVALRRIWNMTEAWEDLYKKQEQAEAGLKMMMVAHGKYTDSAFKGYIKLSREIQALTPISDEATLSGIRMLLAFSKIPDDMVPRIVWAMADMSTVTGRTMDQSAKAFGKLTLDMTGELRRLGADLDVITYKALGFAGALERVERMYYNQAKAIGMTLTGKMQIYYNLMRMLREDVGNFTLNMKAAFIPTLAAVILRFDDWYREQVKMKELGMPNFFDDCKHSVDEFVIALEKLYKFFTDSRVISEIKGAMRLWEPIFYGAAGFGMGAPFGLGPIGMLSGVMLGSVKSIYEDIAELGPAAFGDLLPTERFAKEAAEFNKLMGEMQTGVLGAPSEKRVQEIQARLTELYKIMHPKEFEVPKVKPEDYIPPKIPTAEFLEWQKDYNRVTKTTMEKQMDLLEEDKERWKGHVEDKVQFAEWYAGRLYEINKSSLDAIARAEEEARIKEEKARETALSEFADEYKKATLDEFQYAVNALNQQYDYFDQYIDDKTALNEMYNAKFKKLQDDLLEKDRDFYDDLKDSIQNWGTTFADMLNDMLWGADVTFKDIAKSFAMMISRMYIQKALFDALFAPGAAKQTFGTIGGALSNLFAGRVMFPGKELSVTKGIVPTGAESVGTSHYPIGQAAHGAAFYNGRMLGFAKGTVINHPTVFPMQHGYGLMGEAGEEAILPLKRGPGGDLGVEGGAGGNVTIIIERVEAMDAQSFGAYFSNFTKHNPRAITGPIMSERMKGARI